MIFKWCRSLYNYYICILYEYEIISRECTSVRNSNYIKKNILWKHSVMILNRSWKWEKDKFKKKICHTTEWPLIAKKRYCVPPPPTFLYQTLLAFFFIHVNWINDAFHLIDIQSTFKSWMNLVHVDVYNYTVPRTFSRVPLRMENDWLTPFFYYTCHHRNKGLILRSVFRFFLALTTDI